MDSSEEVIQWATLSHKFKNLNCKAVTITNICIDKCTHLVTMFLKTKKKGSLDQSVFLKL